MIELDKVEKRYGDFVAVNKISFSVNAGELLVLLGGSGSGKTTTLKMINKLITPTGGRIRLDGEDITDLASHEVRRRIGYAFQKIGLFPHMTVAENIGVTPKLLGWDKAKIDKRVNDLLTRVELDPQEVAKRFPSELSGGQQQRVGVARALAAQPKVMLLDEPFGALDPFTRDNIQQFFLRIRKEMGLTAIFVTHDMVEALILGDRIAVMNKGDLVQLGTPHELLTKPADDYVNQLMSTPKQQSAFVDRLIKEGDPEATS